MATAPTGPQNRIRPWHFIQELAAYLEAQGQGIQRRSLFLHRLPTSPVVAALIIGDVSPTNPHDVASHPAFRVLVRDTDITTCAHRAAIMHELLDHRNVPLPSYYVYVTANHDPSLNYPDDNQHPIFPIGFSTLGVVRRT